MPTTVYLIRHGLTDAVGHHMSGRAPGVHLNAEGTAQVERLAQALSRLRIDALYASPLERTQETAEALSKAWSIPVRTAEDFVELDIGDWTGRTFAELDDDPVWIRFNTFRSGTPMPGGESMPQVQARAVEGLRKLVDSHPEGKVAVVSHGDVLRALVAFYLGIPLDLLLRFDIDPASVSVLDLDSDSARLRLLNGRPGVHPFS